MFILANAIYPLICFAMFAGFGSLTFKAAGLPVRWPLLLPIGLVSFIVAGQAIAWAGFTSPINLIVMVFASASGLWFLAKEKVSVKTTDFALPALSCVAATGIVLAPLLLAGRAAMSGFLLDTTAGVQLLGADRILHHGADFGGLSQSVTSEAFLARYFDNSSYPYGAHVVHAFTGPLAGVSLLWTYTPLMAVMAGVSASGLFALSRKVGLRPVWAAIAGVLAAVPALVYAFQLQGSIKEVVLSPCLIAASLMLLNDELRATLRRLAVFGAVCLGSTFAVIGLGAFAWAAPFGLAYAVFYTRSRESTRGWRTFFAAVGVLGLVVAVASIPKLANIQDEIRSARGLSQSNTALAADPGNLLQPIAKQQAVGVWIGGSHRVTPNFSSQTNTLIKIALALCFLGLIALAREQRWAALAWLAITAIVWVALTERGTIWLDAKIVMLSSYAVVVLVIVGADRLRLVTGNPASESESLSRLPATLALALFAGGLLASDALQYRSTGILPTARYAELEKINADFASKGPGYIPDFDEYALFVLRDIGVSGPGNADTGSTTGKRADGTSVGYGGSVDPDQAYRRDYTNLNMVVQRRGPWRSNPGPQYKLVRDGAYYSVWQRDRSRQELRHLSLGERAAVAKPRCAEVRRLKATAGIDRDQKIFAAIPDARTDLIDREMIDFQGPWAAGARESGVLNGAGTMSFSADVRRGQRLWWSGNVDRPVSVSAGGTTIGRFSKESGGNGNVIGPVELPVGRQSITLTRGHGTLAPGDRSGTNLNELALAPSGQSKIVDVTAQPVARICDQQLDWLAITR